MEGEANVVNDAKSNVKNLEEHEFTAIGSKPIRKGKRKLKPMPLFDQELLCEFLEERSFNVDYVWKKLWKHFITNPQSTSFRDCGDIPRALYPLLEENFAITTSTVDEVSRSSDGTIKLLIKLQDGNLVETVIMHYGADTAKPRHSICVSSQIGCLLGCKFCATGTMGLVGNLYAGEIVEQLVHASRLEKVRNVVFMGMGEPLDNYHNVCLAVKAMLDTRFWALRPTRITVSTVGLIPKMRAMLTDLPGVNMAFSLHAPTQELRQQIVPSAKNYPLDKILQVIDERMDAGYNIMLQYILLGGLNDDLKYAHELGKMFKGKKVVVNLIPYNPTDVKEVYKAPSMEQAKQFDLTVRSYGVMTFIRQEKGQDIAGACGQLVVSKSSKNGGTGGCGPEKTTDIEDLVGGGTVTTTINKPNLSKRKSTNTKSSNVNNNGKLEEKKSLKAEELNQTEHQEEDEAELELKTDKVNSMVKNAEHSMNRIVLFSLVILIAILAFLFRKQIKQTFFF